MDQLLAEAAHIKLAPLSINIIINDQSAKRTSLFREVSQKSVVPTMARGLWSSLMDSPACRHGLQSILVLNGDHPEVCYPYCQAGCLDLQYWWVYLYLGNPADWHRSPDVVLLMQHLSRELALSLVPHW